MLQGNKPILLQTLEKYSCSKIYLIKSEWLLGYPEVQPASALMKWCAFVCVYVFV